MSEEIINALTKVEGLHVTARTSSFAFKGKSDDIRAIGQKLNVSTILEGSVRKAGDRVRITAQLINAIDGYHFWSESYDGSLENIFELQDEISRKIANKLIEQLAVGRVTTPLVKNPVTNMNAYNCYLKGIYYWNKWNPQDNLKAVADFKKAIEVEPKFAKAYAWLANCYLVAGAMGFQKTEIVYPLCKEYAQKAMQLEPENPDCLIAIGLVYLFIDWEWEKAGQAIKHAIDLNPGVAAAYQTYSMYLTAVGREDEALAAMEKAASLDPLSLPIGSQLATCYLTIGKTEEAIQQLNKVLDLDPTFRNAIEMKGWAYFIIGEYDTSISILKEYQKLVGSDQKALTSLAYVYSLCGNTDKTNELLERLRKREKEEPENSFNIDYAFIYTGLKDYDKAFYYLNKAVDERSGAVIFLRTSLIWKDLEHDPRFDEIVKKVGFS
jgi:adenylate cyclase